MGTLRQIMKDTIRGHLHSIAALIIKIWVQKEDDLKPLQQTLTLGNSQGN